MILACHQRLAILAKDSARALDILPDHSEKADICQTNVHFHYYRESLAVNQAFLQKVSHSPPNVIQREGMLLQMSRAQEPFQPGLAIEDPRLQILERPVQDLQHLIPSQHW